MRAVTSSGRSEKVEEGGDCWVDAALLVRLFLRAVVDTVPLRLDCFLERAMAFCAIDRGSPDEIQTADVYCVKRDMKK